MIQIIDIFGQFQDKGSGHYYTYPVIPKEETVEWKRFINDPRELPATLNQPAYALWCTPRGWWVAQVQKNANDSRGGFAMAALFLGQNRPADGSQIVKVLQQVAAQYIDAMNWTDDTLAKSVMQPGAVALVPCPIHPFTLGQPSAYRTYSTFEERDSALTFIDQKGYQDFSRIFILPQDVAGQSTRMTNVTQQIPIRRFFTIQCPDGVKANKSQAVEGDRVSIKYFAAGADEVLVENVPVGRNSAYAVCQGNTMLINPATAANIAFMKHFKVVATVNLKGGKLKEIEGIQVRCLNGGPTIKVEGNVVRYPATMRDEIEIEVKHENYETRTHKVVLQDLPNGSREQVETKGKGITVIFDFDGALSLKASETISKSSQKYATLVNQYHAQPSGTNLYVNVAHHHASFDNLRPDDSSLTMSWKVLVPLFLGALLALYGLYSIISLSTNEAPWPFMLPDEPATEVVDDQEHEATDDENGNGEADEEANADEASIKAFEKDVAYLKAADAWERDSLQTEQFLSLYDAIKSGNLKDLRSKDWFEGVEDSRVNGYWKTIKGCIEKLEGRDDDIIKLLKESKDKSIQGDHIAIAYIASQIKLMKNAPATPVRTTPTPAPVVNPQPASPAPAAGRAGAAGTGQQAGGRNNAGRNNNGGSGSTGGSISGGGKTSANPTRPNSSDDE